MEQKYRIVALGVQDGFSRPQSADLLATLFKRPASELSALTSGKRVTVKTSLDLQAAIKYKAALERCGLVADIVAYPVADPVADPMPSPVTCPARTAALATPAASFTTFDSTPSIAATGDNAMLPLPQREVAHIDTCARHILGTLKDEHGGTPGYDLRSVAQIGTDINDGRGGYTPEQSRKIARFYGAFLGKVITEQFAHAQPVWVSTPQGAAIALRTASGEPHLVVPTLQVEQHIANGAASSIVDFLDEQYEIIDAPPPSAAPATPALSVLQLAGTDQQAPLDIAMPLSMCCNCGTTEDVAVLDVELSTRMKGDAALWMELPFCGACTATADRVRPGIVKTGLLTVGTFLLTGLPLILATRDYRLFGLSSTVVVVPVFALATGVVLYLLDRARAPQTSRYQPVTLESLDNTPSGERHVGFAFSNTDYAHAFAGLNAHEISAGRIASAY